MAVGQDEIWKDHCWLIENIPCLKIARYPVIFDPVIFD